MGQAREFRVVTDAVVGGGLHLRQGDVVHPEQLGEYVAVLTHKGAVEPMDRMDRDSHHREDA